jgi:hypothetical protein
MLILHPQSVAGPDEGEKADASAIQEESNELSPSARDIVAAKVRAISIPSRIQGSRVVDFMPRALSSVG